MEPNKTDQTSALHSNNSSSKTEILSIKTSCPIASVSAQSLKSANNDVLFCCGTFEESNKNKLYFSKFNGDAGTLKAAIAVDHYLPPSKLMLVLVLQKQFKRLNIRIIKSYRTPLIQFFRSQVV